MRSLSIAVPLLVALACGPGAMTSEPARSVDVGRPEETAGRPEETAPGGVAESSAERPRAPANEAPAPSDSVSTELDEKQAASGAPAAKPTQLAECCRALREMASQAPPPQGDLVRRAAVHCDALALQADVAAAKLALRDQLPSIDPPAVCH